MLNLVRDALGLVSALGYRTEAGVVGHDFGPPVAAWCALIRPDVFRIEPREAPRQATGFVSSRSMHSTSGVDSGPTGDRKRATTVPSRPSRNFSKFH